MCASRPALPSTCGPHVDRPYFSCKQAPRLASVLAPNVLSYVPLDEEEKDQWQLPLSASMNVLEVNSFSDVEMAATLVCLTLSQPVSCVLFPPARPPPFSRFHWSKNRAHHRTPLAGCPQLRRLPTARQLPCSPSPRPLHCHTRPRLELQARLRASGLRSGPAEGPPVPGYIPTLTAGTDNPPHACPSPAGDSHHQQHEPPGHRHVPLPAAPPGRQ